MLVGTNIILPGCTIWDNWVFENSLLAEEPVPKAFRIFENCVSGDNNLCGKLVSALEFLIKFDEQLKVTLVPFFIADCNLLSCELGNFTFNVLFWVSVC